MQLTRVLSICGMLVLTGGCRIDAGAPATAAEPNRPATAPQPSSVASETARPEGVPTLVDASTELDAGMPDATRAAETEPPPAPTVPHPDFAFVPSGVVARISDFTFRDSAMLDCPRVRIDSSAVTPFQTWCGATPSAKVVTQANGPEVLVIPLTSLTIAANTTVDVTGERPVVFLVEGHVTIDGTLDASARGEEPGPGGDVMCDANNGGDAKGREGHHGAGGGGGAFGSAGGEGGNDGGTNSRVGTAGVERGSPELVPLLGGCRGGHAGGCVGHPGAGGGAIQISASGELVIRGTVAVDGGDGARACYLRAGGTGGGSGGALLFEAQKIDVTDATLRARGGRGGDGDSGASGGAGAQTSDDRGAPGGAGDPSNFSGFGAGGGGGGYGRVRLDGKTACVGC